MALSSYFPTDTKIAFMRLRHVTLPLSAFLSIGVFLLFFLVGFNFGIDFRGGTLIEAQSREGAADVAALRATLGELNIGDVQIQEFGDGQDVIINIGASNENDNNSLAVVSAVREAIEGSYDIRRVETVGPRVSGELIRDASLAVLLSTFAILIYLWLRFEWQFALGAVVTTLHDIFIMVGIYSLLQIDFNLTSVAAILTVLGYSLNDTVVLYDRVREMLRRYKKMPMPELLDEAVNATLIRTVVTSVTTLLAVAALYVFGGEVLRGFSLALLVGVGVGVYSTTFIAAPILIYFGLRAENVQPVEDVAA